eukprot:scaffold988_cov105-Isochrysis_galbana.AAC.7
MASECSSSAPRQNRVETSDAARGCASVLAFERSAATARTACSATGTVAAEGSSARSHADASSISAWSCHSGESRAGVRPL